MVLTTLGDPLAAHILTRLLPFLPSTYFRDSGLLLYGFTFE